MDVYTTSFNVYPFAVPPSSTYPSQQPLTPQQPAYNNVPYPGGFQSPALSSSKPPFAPGQQQQPLGNANGGLSGSGSSSLPRAASGAVHRHQSTLSGVEAVWDHLHRLTLQAMAQYPGTHISFSRTASSASASLSEDSLTLLGTASSTAGTNGGNANGNGSLSGGGTTSSSSMLPSPSNASLTSGGGVMSANANAALLNGPHTRGTAFNVTITGSAQANVMAARGLILRDSPVQNRSVIRVARSEILEPPAPRPSVPSSSSSSMKQQPSSTPGSGSGSPADSTLNGNGLSSIPMPRVPSTGPPSAGASSGGALKQPVIQRLDEIAAQTRANISVLKTSTSSSSSSAPFVQSPYASSPYASSTWGASATSLTSWPSTFTPNAGAGLPTNGGSNGPSGGGSFGGANAAAQAAGLEGEKTCELIITGPGDTVDIARLRLLVMLDELAGLHAEQVDIDYKLHGILAGRRRRSVQQIQEETGTNIYFPPIPLRVPSQSQPQSVPSNNASSTSLNSANGNGMSNGNVNGSSRQGSVSPPGGGAGLGVNGTGFPPGYNPNTIWITGEFFNVGRARDALYSLAGHKVRSKTIISRDIAILSRKLDWMLTHRLDDIKTLQRDNGTYITFPPIGSGTTICTIYGDSRIAIERTVRAIMLLAAQFYTACIWLLPLHYNVLVPSANGVNPAMMGNVLRAVCSRSGAEVVCKSGMFEMHGLESEVRAAVAMILELDVIKSFQTEIRFQLELANEHREFISGKKNGKLNKIMTNTSVKIKFETLNDHNFLIDVSGSSALNVLRGLTLLQDELPAELAFHVPEAYHKRIIGVAGRSIQRIMKKYGVYVKFNSADEMRQSALDDEENVLARTPAKNALNLESLRSSIMELVPAKDKDFVPDTIPVPHRYHRALFGEKAIFLRDIESKTNCKITFPGDGLDVVTIYGPESQVHQAGAMLLDHVPYEAELTVPGHPDLPMLCASGEFLTFTDQVQREYQVSIVPSSDNAPGYPFIFKFRCQRSNCDCLSPAREHLDSFLSAHGVLHTFPQRKSSSVSIPGPGVVGQVPSGAVTPSSLPQPSQFAPGSGHVFGNGHIHRRVDSFTDAFPHFNSRLLPTPLESDGLDRRIRMASSTPDVKALFNSPAHRYRAPEQRVPEQEEYDDASYYSRSSISSLGGSVNPIGGLNDYDYGAPLNANDYSLNDHWMNSSTPTNAHGGGFQLGYNPPRALAHADDAYKRGSDSAIEAKLREKQAASQRQHSLSARAQSLDLTSLGRTSRGLGASSTPGGLGEAPIDEGAIGAEGDAASEDYEASPPISAMMPTFPSLNDVPLGGHPNLMGSTKPRQRQLGEVGSRATRPVLDTDAVTTNDMKSMFASMNLDSPVR